MRGYWCLRHLIGMDVLEEFGQAGANLEVTDIVFGGTEREGEP